MTDAWSRVRERCDWGGETCDNIKQHVTSSGMMWRLVFLVLEHDFYLINRTRSDFAHRIQNKKIINRVIVKTMCDSMSRSQWPCGLRRRSTAARLLRLWVRIPPGGMEVCLLWLLCVLSGRGICDELIAHPEESYRLWSVVVCDLETSWMRRPCPTGGCRAKNKQTCVIRWTTPVSR